MEKKKKHPLLSYTTALSFCSSNSTHAMLKAQSHARIQQINKASSLRGLGQYETISP
jgi:hypothetical protein